MSIDIRSVEAPPTDDTRVRCGRPTRRRGDRLAGVAIVAVGIAMTAILARDGSPMWQTVRAAVAVSVTAFAVRATRTGDLKRRGLMAFTIGLFATAIGVGIGLPYLSKTELMRGVRRRAEHLARNDRAEVVGPVTPDHPTLSSNPAGADAGRIRSHRFIDRTDEARPGRKSS